MTLAEIERVVAQAAAAEPSVLAAWVFGSRARGEARAGSDLDVALLPVPGVEMPAGIEERLGAVIAGRTGLDVDVSRVGEDRPLLSFEVVAEGRRVFARDEARADVAEERIRWTYRDTERLRRVQSHYRYGDPL